MEVTTDQGRLAISYVDGRLTEEQITQSEEKAERCHQEDLEQLKSEKKKIGFSSFSP